MNFNFAEEEINFVDAQRWLQYQQWESYYLDEYFHLSKNLLNKKLEELNYLAAPTDKQSAEIEAIETILKQKTI